MIQLINGIGTRWKPANSSPITNTGSYIIIIYPSGKFPSPKRWVIYKCDEIKVHNIYNIQYRYINNNVYNILHLYINRRKTFWHNIVMYRIVFTRVISKQKTMYYNYIMKTIKLMVNICTSRISFFLARHY